MSSVIISQLERFGPKQCEQLERSAAEAYTLELAQSHYENFTVVSWMLPSGLKSHFANVYAFCRWADDLGDEVGSAEEALELLRWWQEELALCYAGKPRHPVFVALLPTIEKFEIPSKPFEDLIDAFIQDQKISRYQTWEQVVDYCRRSADPVGHLVLYMSGYQDEQRQKLSDATCTALQLVNFWQDVRRDILERDRIYIPEVMMEPHGLTHDLLVAAVKGEQAFSPQQEAAYVAMMQDLLNATWPLFAKGRDLWWMLDKHCRTEIQLFTHGGESIMRMIEKQGFDTWRERPSLSKSQKMKLAFKAALLKYANIDTFDKRRETL